MKKPKKEFKTNSYYRGITCLLSASHFLDEEGEEHKIPHGLKVYYQYRLERYSIHERMGFDYKESHNTVSKVLGLSVDTIKKNYNPLLRNMGLLISHGHILSKDHHYEVLELDHLKGYLINKELHTTNVKMKEYDKSVPPLTYEAMKVIEHNKRQAHSIRRDRENKHKAIEHDRFLQLIKIEREYQLLLEQQKGE
ncbi:conserved hypothetical protein [Vibrio phage 193E37-1]|nr:conserved hypothetical protein [Vibrio phage 193E37-1]